MTCVEYYVTDRKRVCKLCSDVIAPNTWAIVMRNVHVSPKTVALHFHEGCLFRSLERAKEELPTNIRQHFEFK
jgi:hypothetical protein